MTPAIFVMSVDFSFLPFWSKPSLFGKVFDMVFQTHRFNNPDRGACQGLVALNALPTSVTENRFASLTRSHKGPEKICEKEHDSSPKIHWQE